MPGPRRWYLKEAESRTKGDHYEYALRNALSEGGDCPRNSNEVLQAIDRWHAEQFAHLLTRLDSSEERTGTLLDNSAAVWMMAHSDGKARNNNNLPLLQAGSCGGYFKTGVAINVEDGSADLSQGTSSEVCEFQLRTHEPIDGDTPNDVANAPINKYFYNLMNAVGVRANAEGFPEPGGQELVSRFGWSDDPRVFSEFVPANGFENSGSSLVAPTAWFPVYQ